MEKTKTNGEGTGPGRGRSKGSYSCATVKLSELISKLKPDDEVPINIRYVRLKNLAGNLLEATAANIKTLVATPEPPQQAEPEKIISNGIEVTDFNTEKKNETEVPATA